MTLIELATMVRDARELQRHYFKYRTKKGLELSKDAERKLDRAVAEILDPPTLFREDS